MNPTHIAPGSWVDMPKDNDPAFHQSAAAAWVKYLASVAPVLDDAGFRDAADDLRHSAAHIQNLLRRIERLEHALAEQNGESA